MLYCLITLTTLLSLWLLLKCFINKVDDFEEDDWLMMRMIMRKQLLQQVSVEVEPHNLFRPAANLIMEELRLNSMTPPCRSPSVTLFFAG